MITLAAPTINDEGTPGWIAAEQSLIRQYVDHDDAFSELPGCQIVAWPLVAVRRNEHAELGWHAIQRILTIPTWSTEACRHK